MYVHSIVVCLCILTSSSLPLPPLPQALTRRLESVSAEKERLSCELSDVSGHAASSAQTLNKRVESLQKMVGLLEADLERRKAALQEAEEKAARLEKDYEGYKVSYMTEAARGGFED